MCDVSNHRLSVGEIRGPFSLICVCISSAAVYSWGWVGRTESQAALSRIGGLLIHLVLSPGKPVKPLEPEEMRQT